MIAEMEAANRVHANHEIERFRRLRRILVTFHDSLLEVVAERLVTSSANGLLSEVLAGAFAGAK